jgi:hypothetical protein
MSQLRDHRRFKVLYTTAFVGLDLGVHRPIGGSVADPNHMDATVVLYTAKWMVAELVRLLHTLHIDEATAIVDALVQREVAWVWTQGDKKRVLRTGMTWKQQTLVLLLTEAGDIAEADLFRWLEHPRLANFRLQILNSLHADRQIEYDKNKRTVRLLPPGVQAAEALVASFT